MISPPASGITNGKSTGEARLHVLIDQPAQRRDRRVHHRVGSRIALHMTGGEAQARVGVRMSNDGPHISWSETVGNICHGELLS